MRYSFSGVLYRLGVVLALVEIYVAAGGQPGGHMANAAVLMLFAIAWGAGGYRAADHVLGLVERRFLDPRPEAEDFRGEWYFLTDDDTFVRDAEGNRAVFDELEIFDEVGTDDAMRALDGRLESLDEVNPDDAPHYARDVHSVKVEEWAHRHGRLGNVEVLPELREAQT